MTRFYSLALKTNKVVIPRTAIIFAILVLYPVAIHAVDPPEHIYSVQIGSFMAKNTVEAKKAELESLGYSPLFIDICPTAQKLRFGEFPYYMEAYLYREDLRTRLCPDAFVVTRDNAVELRDCVVTKGPLTRLFNMKELGSGDIPEINMNPNDPDVKTVQSLLQNGNKENLEQTLNEIVSRRENQDPVKGWAMMTMGRIRVDRGERAEVKDLFMDIAIGKTAAPKSDRIEAMFRVARIYYSLGDKKASYKAYKEIEKFLDDTMRKEKTEALTELAGLTMELARCAKGDITETRRVCQEALDTAPEGERRLKALAKLINAEVPFYTAEFEKGLQLIAEFEKDYKDQLREYGVILTLKADYYNKLQMRDKQKETLLQIKELPDNIECFKDFNPKVYGDIFYARLTGAAPDELESIVEKYKNTPYYELALKYSTLTCGKSKK